MPKTPGSPKEVTAQVEMRDFGGLASYPDPHDVNPGTARVQVNAGSVRPGELRVRSGFKRVQFDS
jgi:hypothetical protein